MKCKSCDLVFPRKVMMKIHVWYEHRNKNKGKLRIPWHVEEKS